MERSGKSTARRSLRGRVSKACESRGRILATSGSRKEIEVGMMRGGLRGVRRRRALYRRSLWRRRPWIRVLPRARGLLWLPLLGLGGLFVALVLLLRLWR